jgi:hypothetical protein
MLRYMHILPMVKVKMITQFPASDTLLTLFDFQESKISDNDNRVCLCE